MESFTTKKELERIVVYSDNTAIQNFYVVDANTKNRALEYAKILKAKRPNERVVYKEIWVIKKYKIW